MTDNQTKKRTRLSNQATTNQPTQSYQMKSKNSGDYKLHTILDIYILIYLLLIL